MSGHLTVTQLKRATQQTQEWLNDLASRPPFENEEQAYSHLRAVLHAVLEFLTDRVDPGELRHVTTQLPPEVAELFPDAVVRA